MYVDGVEVGSVSATGSITYSETINLNLGRNQQPTVVPQPLEGLLDEVEIFDRALTQPEIQAIFDAGSAGKCKIDHFLCYEAEGASVDVPVDLEDQFGFRPGVLVDEPVLFCNPVDKNGERILNSEAHLTCYEIDVESDDDDEEREVLVDNQFGTQTLEVEEPKLLCVPSGKTLP